MTHFNYVPKFPLGQFIALLTYYKNYIPGHSIDRYLPNGNIEIIIDLTSTPKYVYDNDTLLEKQACKRIWISGMRDNFITIPSGLDAEMMIIEFKKGMVYPFLGMPVTEITGKIVDADLILDKVFTEIREKLPEQKSVGHMFLTVEQMLLKRFSSRLSINPFVSYAVNQISTGSQSLTIKNIAAQTGYSSKHFIKIFSTSVGVTPKLFLRILRFQKVIQQIESGKNINWTALAIECGYYDQAHFISDFKNFSGFTPLEYLKVKNSEFINYLPVQ